MLNFSHESTLFQDYTREIYSRRLRCPCKLQGDKRAKRQCKDGQNYYSEAWPRPTWRPKQNGRVSRAKVGNRATTGDLQGTREWNDHSFVEHTLESSAFILEWVAKIGI